ncbi:hypothetical protein [Virgisporangium aurantiacum]|uniref:hypothetical protein n=1 Tax=Virgisporangium aurantiacum TaxID=175570 RepID=UPI001EF16279|nr:hypothetical protein [Virgisporangium aurantiacum]
MIAAALAAGAGAGLHDTASAAVQDAYARLKELIKGCVGGGNAEAAQALDAEEIEPEVWQARIGDALTDSGAAEDEQILAAARRLLALADPEKAKTLNIDIGTNYGAAGEFHAPVTFHQGTPVPPAPPAAG